MSYTYQRKYHFIYITTRSDGMFYVGMHSTDNLDDGYMGSGARLWHSIKYHGRDKHTREIIGFYPTREALIEAERHLVDSDLLQDALCMNLTAGGRGTSHNENTSDRISARMKEVWADLDKRKAVGEKVAEWWTPERCEAQSELKKKQHEDPAVIANISAGTAKALAQPEVKHNMSSAKARNWQDPEYRSNQIAAQNIGKHTVEYIKKQSEAKLGEKNPNFGSQWIHSPTLMKSMRISKTAEVPQGWLKGRRIYKRQL